LTYQVNSKTPSLGAGYQAETGGTASTSRATAFTNINPLETNATAVEQTMVHEIGHTFALADCTTCSESQSIMAEATTMNDTGGLSGPTTCDVNTVISNDGYS
jgi:hypothetical protein